jgi:hypothetical protein
LPQGVHGVEEFTVFKILKKIIHNTTFASLVEGHQKLLANANFEPKNHYGKRVLDIVSTELTIIFFTTAEQRRRQNDAVEVPAPSSSSTTFGCKRNEIFKAIADEISPAEFTRLSRFLNIPENDIKEIELRHQKVRTRVMVLLEIYETKKSSMKPLLNALTLLGRSDIKNKIEKM